VLPTRQPSLVVHPANGRVPVRPEAEARRDDNLARSSDNPELMSVWDQCISRGVPGRIIPAAYNNAYQIVQTPDYVVIHAEMIHDARIIPLNGGPALPPWVRLMDGESRGHWEGDTLVAETTNFTDRKLDRDQRLVWAHQGHPAEHGASHCRTVHPRRGRPYRLRGAHRRPCRLYTAVDARVPTDEGR
jgi:hypothetical protein